MFAVAGVTGHTGSLVARYLLNRGEPVRAIVRSRKHIYKWRDRGADVVVADLNDTQALAFVLEGMKGAYLLTPQTVYDSDPLEKWGRQNQSIVSAVEKARLNNVVFLSSIGAHQEKHTGLMQALYDAEQKFLKAQLPVTILRSAFFYENWISALDSVQKNNVLPAFFKPSQSVPMVAVEDVARTAVDLLLNPTESHRVVELAGPRNYSAKDIQKMLEEILHKRLDLLPFSKGGWEALWGGEEVSDEMDRLLNATYESFNNKRITFSGKNVETRQGKVTLQEALEKWIG